MQSSAVAKLVAVEKLPSAQGNGAAAPVGQNLPSSHGLHEIAPTAFWYLPASHCTHAPSLPVGATVPEAHGVCSILPVDAKKPVSVSVHSDDMARSVLLLYVPS